MCLKIGTPITITFPFVPNGKLMVFAVPMLSTLRQFVGPDTLMS